MKSILLIALLSLTGTRSQAGELTNVGVLRMITPENTETFEAIFPENPLDKTTPTGTYSVLTPSGVVGEISAIPSQRFTICENDGGTRYAYRFQVEPHLKFKFPARALLKKSDGVFAFLVKKGVNLPKVSRKRNWLRGTVVRDAKGNSILSLTRKAADAGGCSGNEDGFQLGVDAKSGRWALTCCGP